jgi:hypothetical protein
MEEPLTFNLHTRSLLVVLMEELLASGLRHVVDPLRADLHKEDLLQTENLDIKRSSASLIRTRTVSLTKKKETKQKNILCHVIETIKNKELT